MSAADVARRVRDVLVQMNLLPDAGAVDYSRVKVSTGSGGHGSHRGGSAPPRGDSLYLDWDRRFNRLARLAEHELEVYRTGDEPRRRGRDRDRRLASYVDESPAFVAYVEDMSTEGVRKWRLRWNRDPETGRRKPKINGPED